MQSIINSDNPDERNEYNCVTSVSYVYEQSKEIYKSIGVDTDKAIETCDENDKSGYHDLNSIIIS